MGKKIFVSYKYADDNVAHLDGQAWYEVTTVRDYVDELEKHLDTTDNIYKGESDGEDLSQLSEDSIWCKLKDRIYDSTVTIVMISPNMKESLKLDKSQWIPWEVSYSLKETTRNDRTSHTNAMLAIVLPDRDSSYDYYLKRDYCGATTHYTGKLFDIIRLNKFNIKKPNKRLCSECGNYHYYGDCSYIEAVKWSDFIGNSQYYIDKAIERQNDIDSYEIHKEIE